jgi:hypothetical protein
MCTNTSNMQDTRFNISLTGNMVVIKNKNQPEQQQKRFFRNVLLNTVRSFSVIPVQAIKVKQIWETGWLFFLSAVRPHFPA